MLSRLIDKWVANRRADGWDWAAGRLLLGANPEKLAAYVRRMSVASAFTSGAQAAINEWRLMELQAVKAGERSQG